MADALGGLTREILMGVMEGPKTPRDSQKYITGLGRPQLKTEVSGG